jgi:predicted nucleic acid-binding protein
VIYLDTSVALASLLGEDRSPPAEMWDEAVVSSKLLEYEVWARLFALGLERSHSDAARALVGRVALVRLEPQVLSRALDPFPRPVRTLDALHLSTMDYLLGQRQRVELASYDDRMTDVARALGWSLCNCG